jgi:hypothetical protein
VIQALIAILVGVIGVCLVVVGGSLLQVAISERRTRRRIGDLTPAITGAPEDLRRPMIAAAIVLAVGIALIALVVILELA